MSAERPQPNPTELGIEVSSPSPETGPDEEIIAANDRLIDVLEGKKAGELEAEDQGLDSASSRLERRMQGIRAEYDVYYGYSVDVYFNKRETSGVYFQMKRGRLPRKCPIDARLITAPQRTFRELRQISKSPGLRWDKESTPSIEEIEELTGLVLRFRPRVVDSGRANG